MNIQQIIESTGTKASKARKLYDLGYTRHQVADLICGGNYGWAHNIYAKYFGLTTRTRSIADIFNKQFGVEIEAYGISKHKLSRMLNDIGIQTEVQSYGHDTSALWKIVIDSSIGGDESFELVSPILRGEEGLKELKKVCNVLKLAKAKINRSCGLHIHFDARNLQINDWKNIYKNYISLEEEIDSIMPMSRRDSTNTYCKSLLYRIQTKEQAFSIIDSCNTVNEISRKITGNDRYYKINAESFTRHGTVEFRQHSGTIEFDKINNWVKICSALIDKSSNGITNCLNDILNTELKQYISERKNKLRVA